MASNLEKLNKIAPRRIRAQAARWVTELHGPDRDAELEGRVKRWIAQDPRHAAAFELATEAYQKSGGLPAYLPPGQSGVGTRPPMKRSPAMGILAAALIAATVVAIYLARDGTLTTAAGERRMLELSDGTQVTLNANSRLRVDYDDQVRKVTLKAGEALFDVAKHQTRPFVVVIGDRKVVALGTSFMVRREDSADEGFAITLVEGRVAVEPVSWPNSMPNSVAPGAKLLSPGQRLRFARDVPPTVDQPSIEKVTAWQHGQLIFEDTSLREAAAEFNRYGPRRLVIQTQVVGRLRVGGVFRIGDVASFAQAMASTYHLRLTERDGDFVLSDPSAN